MITPFFTIRQDDEFIFIDVKISHIRFSAAGIEMIVQNELFIFSLAPYYLRIRLPFPCVDDERSHAEYNSKTECVNIRIPKEVKGQFFPDLDLTTKLLARLNEPTAATPADSASSTLANKPLIEEMDVDNTVIAPSTTTQQDQLKEGEQFSWEVTQSAAETPADELLEGDDARLDAGVEFRYGFNNTFSEIIGISMSNGNDINELGDAEHTAPNDRIMERLIKENIKFDVEYYAADYIMQKYPSPDDDKFFKELIDWKSPTTKKFMKWYKEEKEKEVESQSQYMQNIEFTKDEQEKLLDLPRKSYLIDNPESLLIALVSLLFSYHFDMRETEGDHNIESAWTVGKLTPQISLLDSKIIPNANNSDNLLKASVITLIRRALSYPLHRNYAVIQKVWDDVYYNLRGGKRLVIKSLLDLRELFRFHDVYYVYNKIWIDDLCSWVISDNLTESMIRSLAHDLKKEYTNLKKTDITFEKINQDADTNMDDEGEDDEDDGMVVLNLQEIEHMAEQLYQEYQQV